MLDCRPRFQPKPHKICYNLYNFRPVSLMPKEMGFNWIQNKPIQRDIKCSKFCVFLGRNLHPESSISEYRPRVQRFPNAYIESGPCQLGLVPDFYDSLIQAGICPCKRKGAIIFYREGGPSVCDRGSPIFSGPPPWHAQKKFWSPPSACTKNSGPPLGLCKTILVPPRERTPPYINNETIQIIMHVTDAQIYFCVTQSI